MSAMKNLARDFLEQEGEDIEDYGGYCGELVDDVLHHIDRDDAEIMYMDVPGLGDLYPVGNRPSWRFHMALFIDGLVHDAHMEEAMSVADYLRALFPNNDVIEVGYNLGGDDERIECWHRKDGE